MNRYQAVVAALICAVSGWFGITSVGGGLLELIFFTPCMTIALSTLAGALWSWKRHPAMVAFTTLALGLAVNLGCLFRLDLLGDFFDLLDIFFWQMVAAVAVSYFAYIFFTALGAPDEPPEE